MFSSAMAGSVDWAEVVAADATLTSTSSKSPQGGRWRPNPAPRPAQPIARPAPARRQRRSRPAALAFGSSRSVMVDWSRSSGRKLEMVIHPVVAEQFEGGVDGGLARPGVSGARPCAACRPTAAPVPSRSRRWSADSAQGQQVLLLLVGEVEDVLAMYLGRSSRWWPASPPAVPGAGGCDAGVLEVAPIVELTQHALEDEHGQLLVVPELAGGVGAAAFRRSGAASAASLGRACDNSPSMAGSSCWVSRCTRPATSPIRAAMNSLSM